MHIKLTSRSKDILTEILNSNDYITLNNIGKKIDVSSRTVLRDMVQIEKWLKKEGYKLIRKPGVGIRIIVTEIERKELLKKLLDEEVQWGYSPNERQYLILFKLLITNEPIKTYFFTHEFKVSEGTISNDLDQIELSIKKFKLKVIRKPGYGIYIEGKERDKRQALINLIYTIVDENQLYNWFVNKSKENINKVNNELRNIFLELIDKDILIRVQNLICILEKQIGENLSDNAYMGLIIHLSIAIHRIRNKEEIKMEKEFLNELKKSDEYTLAQKIASSIETVFNIQVPEDEIGYITMHLKGAKVRKLTKNDFDQLFSNKIFEIVKEIISYASLESGYDLNNDGELMLALLAHLEPAINRLIMGLEIRNPLLQRIKEEYKDIFLLSLKCGKIIEKKVGIEIPESEIGYLAMHLGAAIENSKKNQIRRFRVLVVCASGIGSSRFLTSRIQKEFNNIEVIDIISTINIEEYDFEQVDFIVSTVNFKTNGKPVVVVNPFLNPEDKKKIINLLSELNEKQKCLNFNVKKREVNLEEKIIKMIDFSNGIIEILKGFSLYDEILLRNKEEIIEFIINKYELTEQEKKTLKNEFLQREILGSTILPNNKILVLHCRSQILSMMTVKIIRLKEEIIVEDKPIKNVLVLVAPKNSTKRKIETISYVSKSLIEDHFFLKSFLEDSDDELYKNILRIYERFYQTKFAE